MNMSNLGTQMKHKNTVESLINCANVNIGSKTVVHVKGD